jgi:hypothetical protein
LRGIQGAHEDDKGVNSEIHSEAVIEEVWRYTWRRESSDIGDTLAGRNRVRLDMHSNAVIKPVWRSTWRPYSCELEGHNHASVDIYLQAVME